MLFPSYHLSSYYVTYIKIGHLFVYRSAAVVLMVRGITKSRIGFMSRILLMYDHHLFYILVCMHILALYAP